MKLQQYLNGSTKWIKWLEGLLLIRRRGIDMLIWNCNNSSANWLARFQNPLTQGLPIPSMISVVMFPSLPGVEGALLLPRVSPRAAPQQINNESIKQSSKPKHKKAKYPLQSRARPYSRGTRARPHSPQAFARVLLSAGTSCTSGDDLSSKRLRHRARLLWL
jgi:hypothetical protein